MFADSLTFRSRVLSRSSFLFTSESVSEGHPDKVYVLRASGAERLVRRAAAGLRENAA